MSTLTMPARHRTELAVYVGALGVRTTDLAAAVQVHPDYLSGVIHGRRRPSRRLRRSIAETLGVPEATLFPEREHYADIP